MKNNTSSTPPVYTVDEMRRYAGALPASSQMPILNERAAQAARSVLGSADPAWEQRLRAQIQAIVKEIGPQLDYNQDDGRYTITAAELRGIVARSVSGASGQHAMDIGQALAGVTPLSQQFTETTDTGIAADTAYDLPSLQESL